MRAAVWHGAGDIRIEEIPDPKPGPGEVTLEVARVGICGTDLHEFHHGPIAIPIEPHPLTGRQAPLPLGHELCGEVVAAGDGVLGLSAGDRVAVDPTIRCGECWYCQRGRFVLCEQAAFVGLSADGAMAQFVSVPAYGAYRLPDSIDDDVGALVEPLAVAAHGVRQADIELGDTVAVIGAGPIGISTAMVAAARGAGRVFVVESADGRRRRARELLGVEVLDPGHGDVVEQLLDHTSGRGADVVFECVGDPRTAPLALQLARKGGRAVILGVFAEPSQLSFNELVLGEKEIRSAIGYAGEFGAVIDLLADGRLRPAGMVTAHIGLDDVVAGGFLELSEHRDRHLKILIDPGA